MPKISLKTPSEIKIMAQGGKILHQVKLALLAAAKPGATGLTLENLARKMIKAAGAEASFAKVPGYSWATCINVNDVVVHGIPNGIKFKVGDRVGIDVGVYYQGFHTDTSVSVKIGSPDDKFLSVGRQALAQAVQEVKPGKRIADISAAMEKIVKEADYSPVKALTGHGIGRQLHEEPAIPCFSIGSYTSSPKIEPGMVLAVEVMYNAGTAEVVYKNNDGWTVATADGKISGLFEETVAVTKTGYLLLT